MHIINITRLETTKEYKLAYISMNNSIKGIQQTKRTSINTFKIVKKALKNHEKQNRSTQKGKQNKAI